MAKKEKKVISSREKDLAYERQNMSVGTPVPINSKVKKEAKKK